MRYRKLSPTGDYTFGSGGQLNFYIDTPSAVGQSVKTNLELWLGEWYLDTSLGVPWTQGVLGKHGQAVADQLIQDYVTTIFGVVDISSYTSTLEPSTRKYSVSMNIDTIYGPTAVQIANYVNY